MLLNFVNSRYSSELQGRGKNIRGRGCPALIGPGKKKSPFVRNSSIRVDFSQLIFVLFLQLLGQVNMPHPFFGLWKRRENPPSLPKMYSQNLLYCLLSTFFILLFILHWAANDCWPYAVQSSYGPLCKEFFWFHPHSFQRFLL